MTINKFNFIDKFMELFNELRCSDELRQDINKKLLFSISGNYVINDLNTGVEMLSFSEDGLKNQFTILFRCNDDGYNISNFDKVIIKSCNLYGSNTIQFEYIDGKLCESIINYSLSRNESYYDKIIKDSICRVYDDKGLMCKYHYLTIISSDLDYPYLNIEEISNRIEDGFITKTMLKVPEGFQFFGLKDCLRNINSVFLDYFQEFYRLENVIYSKCDYLFRNRFFISKDDYNFLLGKNLNNKIKLKKS